MFANSEVFAVVTLDGTAVAGDCHVTAIGVAAATGTTGNAVVTEVIVLGAVP